MRKFALLLLVILPCSRLIAQTDYFLIVEQNPGGGFASAVAMAVISVLDDADSVSIISLAYNSTLLLPSISRAIPDLPAIAARVLSLPVAVPPVSGRTAVKYSPDTSTAVTMADDQAGALAAIHPGRNNRLIIIANTLLGGKNVFQPQNFGDRISYIALNSEAEPALKGIANEVWELWEKTDPDSQVIPLRDGLISFLRSINPEYGLSSIRSNDSGFSLGDIFHQVKKSAVIMAGSSPSLTKRGVPYQSSIFQYGMYTFTAPSTSGRYELSGATVVFAVELQRLSPLVFVVATILVGLILCATVVFIMIKQRITRIDRKVVVKVVCEQFESPMGKSVMLSKKPDPKMPKQFSSDVSVWSLCLSMNITDEEGLRDMMLKDEQEMIIAEHTLVRYDKKIGWHLRYPVSELKPELINVHKLPFKTGDKIFVDENTQLVFKKP